ncbi:MAG TPA: flavodoxin family protein [Candidatus Omnitrophota bacterium]|nr:flavodoxin family protein [Candidatus Omnitrophota bacterium]HPS20077.1 flavodoxin family protein [Candidatus Omnitrophota bacterium]
MAKKIVAFVGSYRKGGINDQAVDTILGTIKGEGIETNKYYLTDIDIEFCKNCRICTKDDQNKIRGKCVINDGMEKIFQEIDSADGIILASPINIFTVTAVMKRFLERWVVYAYWPWEQHGPKLRIKEKTKKAVIITSSACPGIIGNLLMPNARQILKAMAESAGAKVVKSLYFSGVCVEEKQHLNSRQIKDARHAAGMLVG